MDKLFYVYIIASGKNGTLYIGITSDLIKRVYEHKNGEIDGFSKKYNVSKLVYFECTDDVHAAIQREKHLKRWRRAWKVGLIEEVNPGWDDLYEDIV